MENPTFCPALSIPNASAPALDQRQWFFAKDIDFVTSIIATNPKRA
jgi:hypothetical protein